MKNYYKIGAGLCLLLLPLLTVIHNSQKPFTLDEAYPFAWNAHEISRNGIGVLGERSELDPGTTQLEIAHPPLYAILLASVFSIGGETDSAGRIFGLICLLLNLFILYQILKLKFHIFKARSIGFILGLITLLNPYMLQYALLIDIDNTVLSLLLTLAVFLFIKFQYTQKTAYLYYTGIALGLALWAKEMTPPLFPVAVFIFYIAQKKYRNALLQPFIITVVGVGFFSLTWILFCRTTGVPYFSFLLFLLEKKGVWFIHFSHLSSIIYMIKSFFFWVSPPIVILFVYAVIHRLRTLIIEKSSNPYDFIYIFILLILFYTVVYIPAATNLLLLKYGYPAFPFIFLFVSILAHEGIEKRTRVQIIIGISTFVLILGYYLLIKRDDPLLLLSKQQLSFSSTASILFVLPVLVLCGVGCISYFKSRRTEMGIFLLICSVVSMNFFILLKQLSGYTTSPSWYNYGEKGLNETIGYLVNQIQGEEIIIARKDIGYYLNLRHNKPNRWIYPVFRGEIDSITVRFKNLYSNQNIDYIVLDQYTSHPKAGDLILPYYSLETSFNNFSIYKKKDIGKHPSQ